MEPKSGQKPINVLSRYLTSWIRRNSEEALPFDSFENLCPRRVTQKVVERWIFNCNYLYNRMGDLLYDRDLIPHEPDACAALIRSVGETFKSISDTTPLDLRSKPREAILYELSRDWPPFGENSRNTLDRFSRMLETFKETNPAFCASHATDLEAIERDIRQEATYYAELAMPAGSGRRALITRCRTLLPIWCAKEINPLITLLVWDDRQAIACLADELAAAFAAYDNPSRMRDDAIDSWREAVLQAQATYLENIDDDSDLAGRTIPEIGNLLTASGFSLDRDHMHGNLPQWLLGKARLIWNIVICAVLGPEEAIGNPRLDRAPTAETAPSMPLDHPADQLVGEALLRRHFRSGRVETVDRLLLDRVCASGLWKVIGSRFDPHAPLPNSDYRMQFSSSGAAYLASEVRDGRGTIIEGAGDSRFHVELLLRIDARGSVSIIARDLDSKNGTCVLRGMRDEPTCYAFPGRQHLTARDWAQRLGIPENRIHMVDEIALERGDMIRLAGSCFELI